MENKKIAVKDFVEQYVSAKTDIDKKKALHALYYSDYAPSLHHTQQEGNHTPQPCMS